MATFSRSGPSRNPDRLTGFEVRVVNKTARFFWDPRRSRQCGGRLGAGSLVKQPGLLFVESDLMMDYGGVFLLSKATISSLHLLTSPPQVWDALAAFADVPRMSMKRNETEQLGKPSKMVV